MKRRGEEMGGEVFGSIVKWQNVEIGVGKAAELTHFTQLFVQVGRYRGA
jgi:hypothetical protein